MSVGGSLNSNVITNATNFEGQNRRVSKYVNVDGLPGINAMVNLGKDGVPKASISVVVSIFPARAITIFRMESNSRSSTPAMASIPICGMNSKKRSVQV